jgi:hypothetical protein
MGAIVLFVALRYGSNGETTTFSSQSNNQGIQ